MYYRIIGHIQCFSGHTLSSTVGIIASYSLLYASYLLFVVLLYLNLFCCLPIDPTLARAWYQCSGVAACLWVWWVWIPEASKPQRPHGKLEKYYALFLASSFVWELFTVYP